MILMGKLHQIKIWFSVVPSTIQQYNMIARMTKKY